MQEMSFLQSLHNSTKRDYFARMNPEKPECMRVAKQYGRDYWDGDRKHGYGGYKYDGRWKPVAEALVKHYDISESASILDIGCGKGFLLVEIGQFTPKGNLMGCDISDYAYEHSFGIPIHRKPCTNLGYSAIQRNRTFDFTYSINVFHNLGYKDLKQAIREMMRVTAPDGKSYICVESYRNEEELCNLQCWALTCQSFYSPDDWKEILTDNGYKGDVEFIYFT